MGDINEQAGDDIDELLHARFKQIALGRQFLAKIVNIVNLAGKNKYVLNLFDQGGESMFSLLTQNMNASFDVSISENLKPTIKSKLEESVQSTYEVTILNNTSLCQSYTQHREYRDFQTSIHEDVTSPFPVHDDRPPVQSTQISSTNIEETNTQTELVLTQVSVKLLETVQQVESTSKALNYVEHFYPAIEVREHVAYSASISHYEDYSNFFAQVAEWFKPFDACFDEFQQECEQTPLRLNPRLLRECKQLDRLAIAAKFVDDDLWYRATCQTRQITDDIDKIVIEFVDYGNQQLTPISECILLSKRFAEFQPCAVHCRGVNYLKLSATLTEKLVENMLLHARVETLEVPDELRTEWAKVYFKKSFQQQFMVEIDQLYERLFSLAYLDLNVAFNPHEYDEPICRQVNEQEIKSCNSLANPMSLSSIVFDGVVSNLSSGLKFIYFNLKQSLAALRSLENELAAETITGLVKLGLEHLNVNTHYLVKYKGKFYRAFLLTPINKTNPNMTKFCQIQLIDNGGRVTFSHGSMDSVEFFVLMPSLFKYNTFALHCRLPFATNIEKVWLKEESAKFYRQIQPGKEYKFKLLNHIEPYILEFIDDKQKIDFEFNSIIKRVNQNDLEPQTFLLGPRSLSLGEHFYLGGQFLKKVSHAPLNLFIEPQFAQTSVERVYLYTDNLLEQLACYNKYLSSFLCNTSIKVLTVDMLKPGDLVLAKPKSAHFLASLNEKIRVLIDNNWSRVQIRSKASKSTVLLYADYGFEDCLTSTEADTYEFVSMPVQLKIWPLFVYECVLNKNQLSRKLDEAKNVNDFIDSTYLNEYMATKAFDMLATACFKVDFTQSLQQMDQASTSSLFTVDLLEAVSGQNVIDRVIECGLADIGSQTFVCVVTHIYLYNDFYVQKYDPVNSKLLDTLQVEIQKKIECNQLKPLAQLELNKLCISFYNEDQQYYRAKIIGYNNANEKHLVNNNMEIEVFYIDFGN